MGRPATRRFARPRPLVTLAKTCQRALRFDCNGDVAAQAAMQALIRQGFHVIRSFDLDSALEAHTDSAAPHCNLQPPVCQFVVLLVYSDPMTHSGHAPVVVTTRGRDGQAETQIVPDVNGHPDEYLVAHVWGALREAALSVQHVSGLSATALAEIQTSA